MFANSGGLAPGFEVRLGGVPVICLPGFPREIQAIIAGGLEARFAELREASGAVERVARRIYRVFGRGESLVSQACRGLVDGIAGVSIHYQVKFPETLVKLVVRNPDGEAADRTLAELDRGLRDRLRGFLYGDGDESLVDRTVRRLIEAGKTVATAESCTGGMIGELLTRRPGSSRAFLGGAITYSNAEKTRQLGVSPETLASQGAVSEATVREMALGARARFGRTWRSRCPEWPALTVGRRTSRSGRCGWRWPGRAGDHQAARLAGRARPGSPAGELVGSQVDRSGG